MSIHLRFPSTFSLHSVILTLLFTASFIPSIHAQKFQPIPVVGQGFASIEGQGLYIFGGNKGTDQQMSIPQTFMIDLSVSWNASDPAFKKLADGPGGIFPMATALPNNEDIFTLFIGTGHIYNMKSNSWSLVANNDFPVMNYGMSTATDPESGIVYFIDVGDDNSTALLLYALNPKTKALTTSKTIKLNDVDLFGGDSVWSASLRSMISITLDPNIMYVYTPSKLSGSSHGWSLMNTTGTSPYLPISLFPACFLPSYNGSKMIHFGPQNDAGRYSAIYILDVTTRKWTKGPSTAPRQCAACGVSGDHFIVWGGVFNDTLYDSTLVFNMKTNKWVSRYTAPPLVSTTTLPVSPTLTQYNPRTTAASNLEDTSTSDKKLAIIIATVTVVLLTIILTAIFIYLRTTRRSKAGVQSTGSNGPSSDSLGTVVNLDVRGKVPTDALPRDPAFPGLDSKGTSFGPRKEQKFTASGVLGLAGARPASEHPHAIVEDPTEKRNAQEGAIEVLPISQHPHAVVERDPITKYNDKAELESSGGWGDKAELEDK